MQRSLWGRYYYTITVLYVNILSVSEHFLVFYSNRIAYFNKMMILRPVLEGCLCVLALVIAADPSGTIEKNDKIK